MISSNPSGCQVEIFETEKETPEKLENELEEQEFKERLERAIAQLPEKQRIAFLMNRIDKKKYREIAEKLGISIKAVEKRMHLALQTMRKNIGNL